MKSKQQQQKWRHEKLSLFSIVASKQVSGTNETLTNRISQVNHNQNKEANQ